MKKGKENAWVHTVKVSLNKHKNFKNCKMRNNSQFYKYSKNKRCLQTKRKEFVLIIKALYQNITKRDLTGNKLRIYGLISKTRHH